MNKFTLRSLFVAIAAAGLVACSSGSGGGASGSGGGGAGAPKFSHKIPEANMAEYKKVAKEYIDDTKEDLAKKGTNATFKYDGRTISADEFYKLLENPKNLKEGLNRISIKDNKQFVADVLIYQQDYSLILAEHLINAPKEDLEEWGQLPNTTYIETVTGLHTLTENLPNIEATYRGDAFYNKEKGKFTYNMDFVNRSGSGSIDGLASLGKVSLKKGFLGDSPHGMIMGDATIEKRPELSGHYAAGFFGPNAEEMAGGVSLSRENNGSYSYEGDIGFAGKR